MVKRKGRESKNTETLNDSNGGDDESRNCRSEDLEEGETSGFFACYLLTSLCPRYKGHTYIGFTVNPRRRIRQHNGELCSGATRTKRKRPWEMVLCIYGFPTNVSALQFEWAWQHPVESLAVRKAAVELKSLGGLASKIKLAYTMLTLPAWNNLNLNVNFFSTKYTIHYAGCPSLPGHMRVHIRSMDDLPCYTEGYKENEEDEMFRIENDFYDDDVNDDNDDEDATCVLDSFVDHENHEEAATSISDSENLEDFPVWENLEDSPVRVPERLFMDYCSNLEDSPIIKDGNGIKICVPPVGGVEVIDLFSPSPEYRKKRAVFGDRPEIIDLTDSPICV